MQLACPISFWKVPFSQLAHDGEFVAGEYDPAAHGLHSVWPGWSWKLPTSHGLQVLKVFWKVPTPQAEHSDLFTLVMDPLSQETQRVFPLSG